MLDDPFVPNQKYIRQQRGDRRPYLVQDQWLAHTDSGRKRGSTVLLEALSLRFNSGGALR